VIQGHIPIRQRELLKASEYWELTTCGEEDWELTTCGEEDWELSICGEEDWELSICGEEDSEPGCYSCVSM
jgi:hypothetical protein